MRIVDSSSHNNNNNPNVIVGGHENPVISSNSTGGRSSTSSVPKVSTSATTNTTTSTTSKNNSIATTNNRHRRPPYPNPNTSSSTTRAITSTRGNRTNSGNPMSTNTGSGTSGTTSTSTSTTNRIYVGNLPLEVTWRDLKDHFRTVCGMEDIVRVDILTTPPPRGRSKGCAILQFPSPERAQLAIQICHNTELKGRLLWAREDREGTSAAAAAAVVLDGSEYRNNINTSSSSTDNTNTNTASVAATAATPATSQGRRVYVGNLSWDVAWQDLKDHMRQVGDVLFAEVMTDGITGRSKGCGIVEFHSSQDAQRAIRTLNDTELKGRLIFVREDRERPPQSQSQQPTPHSTTTTTTTTTTDTTSIRNVDSPTSTLVISNIPWNTTWYQLKDFISTTIAAAAAAAIDPVIPEHVQIIASAKGGRAPYAITRYATSQDAQCAREVLQGVIFMGKPLDVQFDHHQSLRRGK